MSNENMNFQPPNCYSGTDYELWVVRLLTILGFVAKRTGNNDNGVDIIADITVGDTMYKFNIQCKFYNKPVGKAPVQEIFAGCAYFENGGYPVVITNNIMTADALKYAGTLGVEVISQIEFNMLNHISKNRLTINDVKRHTGLLGIMIGQHFKNKEYTYNSLQEYKADKQKKADRADEMKDEISNIFDEANLLVREALEMQMQAGVKLDKALCLHKETLIMHLNYPDSDVAEHMLGGIPVADMFEHLLKNIDSLSPEQFEKLFTAMEKRKAEEEKRANDIGNGDFMPCVHCGSLDTKKYGKVRGKQRFFCKDCNRTFGHTTGTVAINSRVNEQQWKIIIRGIIENLSMSKIAEQADISTSSVWINQIKLFTAIMSKYSSQDNFLDIVECDEYYAPTSFKGKRDAAFFMEILGRLPRHKMTRAEKIEWLTKNGYYDELSKNPERLEEILKSGEIKHRGISNDQTCILTCQDRSGHLVMIPVGFGRLETDDVKKRLSGRFPTDGIMVTDSHNAYPKFAEQEKIQLEQIEADKHTKGAYNLSRINALHSIISSYWDRSAERIPSTKYMDLSLIFMWWLRKNKELKMNEKIEKLYEIITDTTLKIDTRYETIKNREIDINTKGIIPNDMKNW